ncbi:hypothetical protein BDR03DRAFT_19047 [Suillus americanus]|nr:hypothetical protein BDR03DRAFT_19047 [Suillus americanus]
MYQQYWFQAERLGAYTCRSGATRTLLSLLTRGASRRLQILSWKKNSAIGLDFSTSCPGHRTPDRTACNATFEVITFSIRFADIERPDNLTRQRSEGTEMGICYTMYRFTPMTMHFSCADIATRGDDSATVPVARMSTSLDCLFHRGPTFVVIQQKTDFSSSRISHPPTQGVFLQAPGHHPPVIRNV